MPLAPPTSAPVRDRTHRPIVPPDPAVRERSSPRPPTPARIRKPRRTTRFVRWVAEARSHRVICLVVGIWILNGFDLMFTILSHQQGMLHEQNPLARHMLQYGTASVALFKIGLVLIGSYPLLRFRRARITELAALLILTSYAFLSIHWSMCYEQYSLSATTGFVTVPDPQQGG